MAIPDRAPTVLIAGAGPVGLTTARELARRGVRVRLVDAAAGPAATSRALATHARTLEVYDQMGVLADLLPLGQRVEHFTLHGGGRRLIRFDTEYSKLPTRFPFTLMIDQTLTERVLREAAARSGIEVEWGTRLADFTRREDGVTVVLEHAGGPVETVEADWLVGCDGGHSVVRRLLDLPLIGASTETWLIADAVVDTDLSHDSIHWLNTGTGTVMLVPFPDPGKWRLLDTADTSGEDDPAAVASRFARKISGAIGQSVMVHEPSWVSVFTIQQRMIPAMRTGRCLLAGDAAHVHSPASGQGMNTGIQDAYNLAWKLAMVANGQADEQLLDSYSAERVPVGRKLLGSTRTATGLVALKSTAMTYLMPVGLAILDALGPVKHRLERKIMGGMSALGLAYPDSPLSRAAPGRPAGPRPGERMARVQGQDADRPCWSAFLAELRDPRWTLVAVADAAADPHGQDALSALLHDWTIGREWISARILTGAGTDTGADAVGLDDRVRPLPDPDREVADRFGLRAGDWLLIRPDGYLAARGSRVSRAALDDTLAALPLGAGARAAAGAHLPTTQPVS